MTELRLQLASAPLPVAQVLVRAFTGKSALERHNAAFYGMEACIKLSAAARISAWMVDDSEREERIGRIGDSKGLPEPPVRRHQFVARQPEVSGPRQRRDESPRGQNRGAQ